MGTVSNFIYTLRHEGVRSLMKKFGWQPPVALVLAKVRHSWYRFQYGEAAPDPYRLIDIDPQSVTHMRVPRFSYTLSTGRFGTYILDGDWDRRYSDETVETPVLQSTPEDGPGLVRLENFVVYEACKQRFKHDADWIETDIFEAIEQQDVETYPSDIDELFERIDTKGYRTQRALSEVGDVHRRVTRPRVQPELDDVLVNIGREGEIFLDEGKHRFTISRLLDVDSIPCRAFVRHKKWQEKRYQMSEAGTIEELPQQLRNLLEHPDMVDVRPTQGY